METHYFFLIFLILALVPNLTSARAECIQEEPQVHLLLSKTHYALAFDTQELRATIGSLQLRDEQTWKVRPSKGGFLNIITQYNTSTLALGLGRQYNRRNFVFNATLEVLRDDIVQAWSIDDDGTIVSAAGCNLVLKVTDEREVVVAARTGDDEEKFMLQYSPRNFLRPSKSEKSQTSIGLGWVRTNKNK